jgi:serine protease Do
MNHRRPSDILVLRFNIIAIAVFLFALPSFSENDIASLYSRCSPAVAKLTCLDLSGNILSQGTGFLVSSDGRIVTSAHVVTGAACVVVSFSDTVVYSAYELEAKSAELAIIRISRQDCPYLLIAQKRNPPIGSKVYAISSPRGLGNTLSEGIISGIRPLAAR